jgi:hypothetical protein
MTCLVQAIWSISKQQHLARSSLQVSCIISYQVDTFMCTAPFCIEEMAVFLMGFPVLKMQLDLLLKLENRNLSAILSIECCFS